MSTLNQQYEKKVRPCIDLIDSLRSLGVEKDLALPAIAVIGDQSSGKRSVLEALSGVALPRGSDSGIIHPLELKMKRKKEGEEWYGKIYKYFSEEIEEPADVEKKIREVQNEMSDIGDYLISLEIGSPDVPDLTLIDFPNIAWAARMEEPENIGDQLIQKFIRKQETINLVVVPCNVDIATTEALKMALKVDPDGERTLVILTKPDLVKKGTEETVVDIVHNDVIHLKKGYMIVKCRGQKEITEKVSLTEAIEREKAFFKDHAYFQILYDEGHATVPKLAEKLTLELVHHIEVNVSYCFTLTLYSRSLPRLEEQIEEKLEQTCAKLERYGNGPPTDPAEKLVFLNDKVTTFTEDAIRLTTGEELKCGDELSVFSTLRTEFMKWNAHLTHSGEILYVFVVVRKRIEREVAQYEEKYRGRELPSSINYKTFEVIAKEQIKQLEELAVKRLKNIGDAVMQIFIQLAKSSFTGFPNLLEKAKTNINYIKNRNESTAEAKMEMLVDSQDRTYSSSLSDSKRKEREEKEKGIHGNHATLQELMLQVKSYYEIASQHLDYQVPLVIRYQILQDFAVQLQREMLQILQENMYSTPLLQEDCNTKNTCTVCCAVQRAFTCRWSDSGDGQSYFLEEVITMSTLNQQYEEKVRPCIDLIDSLRSLGVEKDLALPAIAVIGDQSSGKSSVLEALSGVSLPRGSGIVTRCPLELKMKRRKEGEEWYGKISYQGDEEEIEDPADVEEKIREAQNEMAGPGSGISEDLISLEIASPDVPDLTLIDLPGIARVAVKGQPENIGEQIKRLIQKFIKKQETISLVVVPCNVDIATTEALKMAQEVDPDGERSLGILTKPDLVDKGTENTTVEIVHNEVIHLKKGYMIVKCRGQKEITENVSLTEAIEREKAFFKDHAYFHMYPEVFLYRILYDEGHATVPKLAEKLTLELVHHIQKSLPRLEEQIEKKLIQTQTDLDRYGNEPPSDPAERLSFLIDRMTAFTQDAISLTTGEELRFGVKVNIFSTLRKEFAVWKEIIESSGVTFNWNIEREVVQYERKYRGRELPGFINYKTFEGMVKEQIKLLEEPAVLKLKEVAGMSYHGATMIVKIEEIRKEKEIVAESMLRTQFKMESIVYTQDSRYSKKLGKRKREDEPVLGGFSVVLVQKSTSNTVGNSEATLKEMIKHLKSYYQIAGQRLADQVPLVIRYQMLHESAIQLQREMLQMLQDKEKLNSLLQEDSGIKNKRIQLQLRFNRLTKARILLTNFSMNIYNFNTTEQRDMKEPSCWEEYGF
ncbi:Mx Interferon-inducible [Collichthys lucidus]|uniref:Interferon-induced GTP-binding protein Mx n=1 Tax=Collichthys lucidus TaxID=240159 RepID=A0A4U5TVK1_COLLU|nr:Mx Interferon-inducible [Collichthys lucidus]